MKSDSEPSRNETVTPDKRLNVTNETVNIAEREFLVRFTDFTVGN